MIPANALAACAQVAAIVLISAGLPRLLRLSAPGPQYLFWRVLLAVCLLLPIVQPRVPADIVFVPAPVQAAPPAADAGVGPSTVAARIAPFDWFVAAQLIVAAGIGARLARMALGIARLRRMRQRATDPVKGFEELQHTIGTHAPILWSADVRHPVCFGAWKPVVLLPVTLRDADPAAQRAVVAHELHHVKRRDWLWIVAEELVRSVLWFHPALWWLISRVQLARETVVDELSILVTNARRTYLDTLLAVADDTGFASTPAFSARRHLFHRVTLLSKEGGMSSIRVAVACSALFVALGAGAAGALWAFPLQAPAKQTKPPRDPLSPEMNHRIAVEYWEKANKDLSLTPDEKLDTVLRGIAAEDRALAMNPEYVPALTYKNLFLRMQANLTTDPTRRAQLINQADELHEKTIALRGVPPPPPPPPKPSSSSEELPPPPPPMPDEYRRHFEELNPVRIGNVPPLKIRDVKPAYPPVALAAGVQGIVVVEAIIDGAGRVAGARVLRSIPLLDAAAMEAVEQWEFRPVLSNGVPQPVVFVTTVNFTLK